MMKAIYILVACLAIGLDISPVSAQDDMSSLASAHQDLVNQYCVTCHNAQLKTANLFLDQADIENVSANGAIWEKVIRKLRTGAMPPAGLPRPEVAEAEAFATYLENELDRFAAEDPDPGRPVVHRLNRTEYGNAVRDLLAVEFDEHILLPNDDSGHGFDTVGEALSVSPLLAEAFMSTARKISSMAVGDKNIQPLIAEYEVSRQLVQNNRMSEDLPFGTRGGAAIRHHFPLDGEYVIKVRLQRNNDNYIRGLGEPHQLDIRIDSARIKSFMVGGEHKGKSSTLYSFVNRDYLGDPEQENYEFSADEGLELRFHAQAGTREIGVAFVQQMYEQEGEDFPRQSFDELLAFKGGEPGVDKFSISGPYNAVGLGTTLSRNRIFNCYPTSKNEEGDCAEEILTSLAHRAYRRPLNETDIQTLLKYYSVGQAQGGFEAGIRTGIQGILVSPNFLFRVEREPKNITSATPYLISDLDLASRLSFFLWSSIPDDTLLLLAEAGTLHEPKVLAEQVQRMLSDIRSRALIENFTAQWLGLRKLDTVSPDPDEFPHFDENLRQALKQETVLFAESIAREDRSLLDFLRADYTFVNDRLADHYGIPNVVGSGFRRVSLSDGARKGLLGKGSILTVTSYANRTSPTLRGKWVLDTILGTPPPPPPPNIPALKDENTENGRTLTMRERMEQHRVNPSCAVCHNRMDPLGFAMDNFDAIGRWRTQNNTTPIDSSGVLPDGTAFQGPAELTQILLKHPEQFLQTLTEKLLMYALGRGLEYYDQPVVRQIIRTTAVNDYRWSSVVTEIVKSMPFQMRRSRNDDI
jgi:mono/diheme cytochrome c family protein